jgi:DNA polymerase-3 subunit gamma/tau
LGADVAKLALYRKYRPQNFDELYGQNHVAVTLKNSIKSGNFSHAYLFCGPRGTGKTSVARILAKAINCEKANDGNPDNACQACSQINQDKSMDIIEIDAASHTQVDNIREIIVERAHFAPTSLKYKVYIIDEAHMLSKSSFNALLKTLEEPPEHAIFILATTEASKIIPTIVSRCQRFDFRRINTKDIVKRLDYIADKENIKLEEGVTELIAKLSEGGFRDAISLLDQIASIGQGKITKREVEDTLGISDNTLVEDMIFALTRKDQKSGYELVAKLTETGIDSKEFTKSLSEYLRKLMIASLIGIEELNFSKEAEKTASETLKGVNTKDIVNILDVLIQNEQLYRHSNIPSLGLEISIAKICLPLDDSSSENQKVNQENKAKKEKEEQLEEAETKVEEKVKTINTRSKNSTDEVKWQEVLLEVKNKNNSIHAFLRVSNPQFSEDTVLLHFPYQFHKERIEDIKNRQIVENALTKVYGKNMKLKCKIKADANPNRDSHSQPKKDDLLVDALEIFGGEIVE